MASLFYKFFDKSSVTNTSSGANKIQTTPNQELPEELLENVKHEKYTHLLNTIFRMLILWISN